MDKLVYSVKESADADTAYGFSHYTKEPTNPRKHRLALIPQSITDSWNGFCQCGRWRANVSFNTVGHSGRYGKPLSRDEVLSMLRDLHATHVSSVSAEQEE